MDESKGVTKIIYLPEITYATTHMSTSPLLQAFGIVDALGALTGTTLAAVVLVLAVVLFVVPFRAVQKRDVGTAHALAAGIGGLGFVFLFLVVIQLLHSPI